MQLKISVYGSPSEAPHFVDNVYLEAYKANIVLNGTTSGAPTVDFEMFDKNGKLHTVMLTSSIMRALASVMEEFDRGGGNREIRVMFNDHDDNQSENMGTDNNGG